MANVSLEEEEDDDILRLALSSSYYRLSSPPPTPSLSLQVYLSQPPPQHPFQLSPSHPIVNHKPLQTPPSSALATHRRRRNPTQSPPPPIPPPFPWATDHRATVHSILYLVQNQIFSVFGEVQCKRCEKNYEIGFDLRQKFFQVASFIVEEKSSMHDRAPSVWMSPVLPPCRFCHQENSTKPILAQKKKNINWLFLFLGQMLGCCTLEQLKYFCKHTKNHRTGAKDRVLYLTYLALCKQLDPNGPFQYGE